MKHLLLILGAVIILSSCGGDNPTKTVDTKKAWTYEVINIDGMHCIKWSNNGAYLGGLTCNWDEWKGEAR